MNLTKLYEMDDKRQEGQRLEQENSARAVSDRLGISINSVNAVRTGRNALISDEHREECLRTQKLLKEGMRTRKQNSMSAMAKRFKKSTCTIARLLKHRSSGDTRNNLTVPSWAVRQWTKSPDLSMRFYY